MERKITIEESVPYTEDYQNKMLEEGFLTLTILSTDFAFLHSINHCSAEIPVSNHIPHFPNDPLCLKWLSVSV